MRGGVKPRRRKARPRTPDAIAFEELGLVLARTCFSHGPWHAAVLAGEPVVGGFSRWGRPDPYAQPAIAGRRFGVFVDLAMAAPHPRSGFRARVRCAICGAEREVLLARVRHSPPVNHRGCSARRERRAE